MPRHLPLAIAAAALSLSVAACGILTAPFSVADAVSSNADYSFKGTVVDPAGEPLSGIVVTQRSSRRWWTPIAGGKSVYSARTLRVDGHFTFDVRGENMDLTFSKDGYKDVEYRFSADASKEVSTTTGDWPNSRDFKVLMIPINARDAYLVHRTQSIDYERYPIADAISLPNLLTNGSTGEVIYKNKDATDPTVFPDGTLYLLVDKEPPKPLNAKGDIDPADLDIPAKITLRIPGENTGFVRMTPTIGLHPMLVSTTAPENGYNAELTFERPRLKQMREAPRDSILGRYEYFYFRSGNRFGKGTLSWSTSSGKPAFTFNLYLQQRPHTRDLATYSYK